MKTISQECQPYYCTLAALLPVGIFHTDIKGHYLTVNDRWCELTGVTAVESQGEGWAQALHPDDKERVFAQWYQAVQQNLEFQSEYRFQHLDGKTTWVLAKAIAQKNDTGVVTGYVGIITDISDRKQTEAELSQYRHHLEELVQERTAELQRTNEQLQQKLAQTLPSTQEFLTNLLDYTPAPIYIITAEGQRYRLVNRVWEELIGIHREEVIGHSFDELFPSEVAQQFQQLNQRVIDQGAPIIAEEFVDVAAGRHYFHTVKFPIHDASGQIEAVAGISLDITERKRMEEALRESEEQYRRIIETASEGIWTLDAENKTISANHKIAEMLGYTVDEMLGMPLFAFLDEEVEANAQSQLERRRQGIQEQHDFKFRRKDGSNLWAIVSATPILDTTGQYVGAFGMITDITDRKRAEEALRQSEERFRLLAENSTDMISRHTPEEGIYLYASPACQTLLGYTSEELVGHSAYEFFHPDDLVQIRRGHASILNLPVTYTVAYRHRCKDGHYIWLETTCRSVRDQHTGAILEIHSASRDITERKRAEEALRQQVSREQLIARISQRIHQSLNLKEILNTTVTEVRQFLSCDRVIIFRFDLDGSGIVVVESVDEGCTPILNTTIYEPCFEVSHVQLYREGRVNAIPDIYTAKLSQCHIDLLAQFQVRANLVVPILEGEHLWGLLIAHHCSGTRQWQEFEMDLLKSLAIQTAIAIQQSELYKQTQHQVQREQALNRVIHSIRNSLDLTTIFSTAVSEIGQLLQADRADIMQYLPERKAWLNVADYHQNSDLPTALGQELPDDFNKIAARLKRLEIVRIDYINTCEDEINQVIAKNYPGAWLLVPLHFGSSVWGSLSLRRNAQPSFWQDSEVELASAIADQLAIALQQAELYQQSCTATAKALTQTQQLEQALQELQNTQAQLVQSEKMSSLGQLVAGVAHEINNPVTFIYANLDHAEDYTQDILRLVQLYQQQYPHPTPAIESAMNALDLDFVIEDLPRLVNSMKVGAERICEIVAALRNFSRLAEAEIKAVNIHEGLDSTLTILQNRLKAQGKHPEIQVIKKYSSNLPKVECYAGQLNQVFMNLLSNAIDALDEHNQMRTFEEIQASPSLIQIHTELLDNDQIAIRIADNGLGMTEQVKARIFDPFFTTKPVGTGTGLGLSISYQIVVEKHGGQLDCFSHPGQGTEFLIQIPLVQHPLT